MLGVHTDTRPHPDPDGVGGGADSRLVVTLRAACGGVCLCLAAGALCLRHNGTKGRGRCFLRAPDGPHATRSWCARRWRSEWLGDQLMRRPCRKAGAADGACTLPPIVGTGLARPRATELVVVSSSSCATLLQPQVMRWALCLRRAAIVRAVRRRPLDRLPDRFAFARTPACRWSTRR